jgi:DNA-directed RNA polymerase specialized sigma24 family protein
MNVSLCAVSDAFLAGRVRSGDEAAFAELARRYRPLLMSVAVRPPLGVDSEDLRQHALLGLLGACADHARAKGSFAAFASRRVRWEVTHARQAARAHKHGVLSYAVRDGDEPLQQVVGRLRAPEGSDPARVVELRDELRYRVETQRRGRLERRRRGYSLDQVERALAMIAAGRTVKEAAFAIGAPHVTVHRWLKSAGAVPVVGRRRFTAAEVEHALALVEQGASQREAGAAVGASPSAVMGWVRRAGRAGQRREFSAAEIRRALELVEGGVSPHDAGAAVGASKSTVIRWKREAA